MVGAKGMNFMKLQKLFFSQNRLGNNIVIIIAACIALLLCSCVNNSDIQYLKGEDPYEIIEISYADCDERINKNIAIVYPQIQKLNNTEAERLICEEIEKTAFAVLSDFTVLNDMNIDVSYSVTYASADILSIHFIVRSFHSSQAYPLIRSFSANFLVETGKKLELTDVINVNDEFFVSFFNNFELSVEPESKESYERILEDAKDALKIENFLGDKEDIYSDAHGFFTEDALVVSIEVRYSNGSYALFKANYPDIKDFLKINVI